MTEDMTCSDLSRILGRFKRLHPGVSVRAQVHQSLTLRSMLGKGAIDIAVMQIFKHEIRPADVLMSQDQLHWVAAADFKLDAGRPIPFLSFDEHCFYRRWAFDVGQEKGLAFETVLECASAAGIVAGICAGLGVALLDEHHLRPDMQIMKRPFPAPPAIAYVVRIAGKSRNKAVDALVREITRESIRHDALRVA
jgi:DNA-binding transcriptional LysR family regulator